MPITLQGARPALTYKRPSYQPTGTHPSQRSVLVWRLENWSNSQSSTSRPTLCTHWSLMGNTAPLHWVVGRGRSWLAHRPPYRTTVTRKGSMLLLISTNTPGQESVSWETMKMIAKPAIPELALEQEAWLRIPTAVEMRMVEGDTSKPWDTSWSSRVKQTSSVLWKKPFGEKKIKEESKLFLSVYLSDFYLRFWMQLKVALHLTVTLVKAYDKLIRYQGLVVPKKFLYFLSFISAFKLELL